MKITSHLFFLLLILSSCNCKYDKDVISHTNYGHNIVVVTDLSNRILNTRKLNDPGIVQIITADLKTFFQQSIDFGINDKFFLTTFNDQDFKNFSDSVFKIDLTRFQSNALDRSNYLYHSIGPNSFGYDQARLNKIFNQLYQEKKDSVQLPADVWYFVQDKLTFPLVDTSESNYTLEGNHVTNKYNNYIIFITDGYIEAGRYGDSPDMKQKNKIRYLSKQAIDDFRNKFKNSGDTDYKHFFTTNEFGIIPVKNPLLKNCKLLILELFDRSIQNGVTTQTPTDLEIIKLFWSDWLSESGINKSDITLLPCYTNIQDLSTQIKLFFETK